MKNGKQLDFLAQIADWPFLSFSEKTPFLRFLDDLKKFHRKAHKELESGRGKKKLEIIHIFQKKYWGRFWAFF